MPRILYIGSGNPWQGGAGFLVRQNLFLGALSEIADLHLAMFDFKPGPFVAATPASPLSRSSIEGDAGVAATDNRIGNPPWRMDVTSLVKPKRATGGKLKNLLDDAFDRMPRMLRGYDMTEARQQVAALNPADFDAVFAYRIDFAHFAGVLNHPRLILDIDDPEHVRGFRRLQALGGGDRRTLRDLEKLRAFERRSVAGAQLAFVCQANDQGAWDYPPEVVPNCVQVLANPARNVSKPIVLFVGNCAGGPASPNVDAVRFFLSDIWPKVLQAVPGAELHIVGSASDSVKQPATAAKNVVLRGFVDDLSAVYAQSSVSIAPIRFGTGTRVKILEAFAHGCPVVATLAGAEGINAIPGKEIELAAGADHFAERTVSLLSDSELNKQIGIGGHQLAVREYDAVSQTQKLVVRFDAFLAGSKKKIHHGDTEITENKLETEPPMHTDSHR